LAAATAAAIAAVPSGLAMTFARQAWAGAQREEDLSDSVRSALSAAVAERAPPAAPPFPNEEARQSFLRWTGAVGAALKPRMAEAHSREDFIHTLWYEATRAGLEPALVLGLIEVESGFRKYAISAAGARGYMQVMPFWTSAIGDGEVARLFHLQTNLRFGCVILRHYLNLEQGDLFMALGRYNGTRGQAPYPQAVLAARQRWRF
jgi:soluble lytic murein transglycosylase-like protein